MLTVWPVASLSPLRCGAEMWRSSIELIAENPRSSTRGPSRYFRVSRVLLQVSESRERRHVPVGGRTAEADDSGEVADAEKRLRGLEGRQNGEAALQRLRSRRVRHGHVLLGGTPS